MQQPTELELQYPAMLAVAALTQRMAAAGVPQTITPAWDYTGGLATGVFPENPDALVVLSAWCNLLGLDHRVSWRDVVTPAGGRRVWTIATTVDEISVHISASVPLRTSDRELVNA
ncbi:hypothetical protein [Streptomyces sp. NRRL B-24484]|uniref:hypothetical protein n=1 Tax=Streptomyces sp. NRRL B-24484 TaxID=1463833 RepID=UPI0004C079AE|nr:hypothetical protein [Streptomyces sp. NRRL B-24484]